MEELRRSDAVRRVRTIALAAGVFAMHACVVPAAAVPVPHTAQSSAASRPADAAPTDPARQIEAVRNAFDAGHSTEALRLANTFSAQQKDNAEFHTQLGVVLATNKQYKAAQLELEKANALKARHLRDSLPARANLHSQRQRQRRRTHAQSRSEAPPRLARNAISARRNLFPPGENRPMRSTCSSVHTRPRHKIPTLSFCSPA